jgi:hypothetical protein
MSPSRMKLLLEQAPFVPFTIVKGDGGQVNVISPKLALLYPGGRTLHVVTPKFAAAKTEEDFEDHYIDVFLVTDVINSIKPTNGHGGRRR